MIYLRRWYRLLPEQVGPMNEYFHLFVLPAYVRHGAKLMERRVTADGRIMAVWEYESRQAHEEIEERFAQDEVHVKAREYLSRVGPLFVEKGEAFFATLAELRNFEQGETF